MSLDVALKCVQIGAYLAGLFTALWAVRVYRDNSRRDRARWAESLYSRFFEKTELKTVRDLLDTEADAQPIIDLVTNEGPDWTDYLNFFEFVAYLQASKQLEEVDVQALFGYYLLCLKRHSVARAYINDKTKGFDYLREILRNE